MLAAAFLLLSGFTMSWDPVTTYTDNTLIGPEAQGVFYNVEMDGVQVVSKTSATSWVLPVVPKKSTHSFRGQAELGALDNTGVPIRSAWSPFYSWTSPAGNPNAPGQLRVAP
jgi:hypothetical protein